MKRETLYLALTCIGAAVPMAVFFPWLFVHGVDLHLFFAQLFANRISTFFAVDLLLTACVVCCLARDEKEHARPAWLPILVMLCTGVSAGLPLLLYLREKGTSGE